MPRGEEPPKGEPRLLTPEEKSAAGDAGLAAMDQFFASVPVDRPSPEPAPAKDASLVETRQENLADVTQTIPAGQHWVVENALDSTITVLPGAKLTITSALGTKILVHEGGEARILEDNLGSEINYVKSDTSLVAGADTHTRTTLPNSDPILSTHPAPEPVILSAAALNIPKDDKTPNDAPATNPLDGPVLDPSRRNAQRKPKPGTTPPVLPPTTADATVATATTADKKAPVIESGRYKDENGLLCDVREENGEYYYTPLEGKGKGAEIKASADHMRILMGDEWKKVADTTLPTPDVAVSADPVVLPQTPDAVSIPDATLANTPVANVEAGKKKITVQELLTQVPDGGVITVSDKDGPIKFRRQGDRFMTTAKNPAKADGRIIRMLTHGGRITAIDGIPVTPAPDKATKPDTSAVAAKAPDAALVTGVTADPVPVAPAVPPAPPQVPPVVRPTPAVPPVATPAPSPVVVPAAVPPAPAPVSMPAAMPPAPSAIPPAMPATPDASIPVVPASKVDVPLTLVPKEGDSLKGEPTLELVPKEGEIELSEEEKEQEHMDGLLTGVKEARFDYVTRDYKQNSTWQKIKNIFGKNVSETSGDQDTESAKEVYELALSKLQDAQLGALKKLGLSDTELHKRMGEMLLYYKYDERLNMYNDRNQVKLESMNNWGKLVSAVEGIGRGYNKLPRWLKYTVGGASLATGLAVGGGVIGGGVAAAAGGTLLIKRLIATAGLAVTVDTGIEQWMEGKKRKTAEEEQQADLRVLESSKEEGKYDLDLFKNFLERENKALEEKFKLQKKEALVRRSAVWGTAVVGMIGMGASYASHLGEHGTTGRSIEERAREYNNRTSGSGVSAVERSVSAPASDATGASFVDISSNAQPGFGANPMNFRPENMVTLGGTESGVLGSGVSPMSPIEQARFLEANGVNPDSLVSAESVARIATLREDYTVTAADGKKGLWGVIEKRLPADMPKGDRSRIIASLENLMRKDLAAMSPAERAAAGFAEGKLDLIHEGKVIQFHKFISLTPDRIQAIMEGQSVGAPSGLVEGARVDAVVPHADDSMNQAAMDEAMSRFQDLPVVPLDQATPTLDTTEAVEEANAEDYEAHVRQLTDPRQFIIDNPGSKELLFRTTARLHSELLMLMPGEEGVPFQYDYAANGEKLGNTLMTQVLKDFESIRPRDIGVNPLHPDQERALANLFRNATKVFGIEAAQPKASESATYYIGRMATAALRKGIDIKVLLRR